MDAASAWVVDRCPDVAVAEAGFLYRRGQLVAKLTDVPRIRSVIRKRIATLEKLAGGAFARILLVDGADALALADEIADRYGEPLATPNHVFRGALGVPAPPVAVPYVAPPVPVRGRSRVPQVAVLDTGWVLHRWLWRIPANLNLDPAHAEVELDVASLADGGITGHGLFTAGLVLRACPETRVVFRRVLDGAGVCDEIQLAAALRQVTSETDVVLVPAGGFTWNDRPSAIVESALAVLPSGTAVVAAAGNAGECGRPFWPAASERVTGVGALTRWGKLAPFSNRGPWVDAAVIGVDVESAFPDLPRGRIGDAHVADGYARWSGTSFSAALVAGIVAARVRAAGESGSDAVRSVLAAAPPVTQMGPAARRPVLPHDLYPAGEPPVRPHPPAEVADPPAVETEEPAAVAPEEPQVATVPAKAARTAAVGVTRGYAVSTGFAPPDSPHRPLPRRRGLEPDTDYLFWFELRPGVAQERDPVPISVVLARFDGELVVDRAAEEGRLELRSDGAVAVTHQPTGVADQHRLYFPVRTPPESGTYRLRCSLCHGDELLQSVLVEVRVGAPRWSVRPAVTCTVDYRAAGE